MDCKPAVADRLIGNHTMLRILAIVCPPFAVLRAGRPTEVAANVGLSLLFYLPGLFHALLVVDRHETERRNETLMRVMAQCET